MGLKWCSPAEFWAMPPGEFWWLYDAHTPQGPSGDMEELYQLMMDAQ